MSPISSVFILDENYIMLGEHDYKSDKKIYYLCIRTLKNFIMAKRIKTKGNLYCCAKMKGYYLVGVGKQIILLN